MQSRRIPRFGFPLLLLGMGSLWAAPPASNIVGIVTERQGSAYRQSDIKKTPLVQQSELLTDSKLVLSKGSKLVVVYLTSGLEYELNGPGIVQFKNDKPVSLSGQAPKVLNAELPFSEKASKIDPKKVHTAGQTLVSTEKKEIESMPVAAAPSPAPVVAASRPLPAKAAPRPAKPPTASTEVAASAPVQMAEYELEQQKMAAYEAAKRAAEAEAASASAKSEVAKSEAWKAEKAAAEAAYSAAQQEEKMSADAGEQKPACPPPSSDNKSEQADAQTCSEIKD